ARPSSASTVRLGWAGIGRNPPTLVMNVPAAATNEPAVLPVLLTEREIVEGPEVPDGVWKAPATLPPGPITMSPKFPADDPGRESADPNALTVPKPVTVAPRATKPVVVS